MSTRTKTTTALAAILGLAATGAATAWAQDRVDLQTWDRDRLNNAWQADQLIEEADAYGIDGEEIGEVEDIIVGPDDKIRSIIVEAGGFLDIGDTHFAVPWNEVEIEGYDTVRVPVSEDTLEDYDIFRDMDDEPVERRAWRVSELIGDYAYLEDDMRYGYVDDVLFDSEGKIVAVTANTSAVNGYGGPYAYPYYGYDYGWTPGSDRYGLGYTRSDVADVEVIDYEVMEPEVFTAQ
ncbi:MAG: PRC-barrel domain-containing protein [Inquilinaceae bacterium]